MANKDKLSLLPVSSEDGTIKPGALKIASLYETQSESELLAVSESLPINDEAQVQAVTIEQDKSTEKKESSPLAAKLSVRSKRREKRLRNEPPNITGRVDSNSN